ncbi:unnamed protein product [Effrenium voratum]|uniref:Helicase C-terminal domain-containing protein n=1 Tax=Effrenium voratum TaxID=2562239 RepID=A0AA36MTR4_9DINO|nr:unnamed protein product [Effrenium voratum]
MADHNRLSRSTLGVLLLALAGYLGITFIGSSRTPFQAGSLRRLPGSRRAIASSDISDGEIFVSIAAYADPELPATMMSLIAAADRPELIRFGIVWQGPGSGFEADDLDRLATEWDLTEVSAERPVVDLHLPDRDPVPVWEMLDGRIRSVRLEAEDARGPCWARYLAQLLWKDESLYLQLDSHMRFTPGWDSKARGELSWCSQQSEKPVLCSYGPGYSLGTPYGEIPKGPRPATVNCANTFDSDGILLITARDLKEPLKQPEKHYFWGAQFSFSSANVLREVPYDPQLQMLFFGEESLMAVRLFTHGWDVFTPKEQLFFHLWERDYRRVYWKDNRQLFASLLKDSQRRVRALLESGHAPSSVWPLPGGGDADKPDAFGLGSHRTLGEYEAAAGVYFKEKRLEVKALRGGGALEEHHFKEEIEMRSKPVALTGAPAGLEQLSGASFVADSVVNGRTSYAAKGAGDERFVLWYSATNQTWVVNFGGVAHGLGQEATLLLYSESFSGEPTDVRSWYYFDAYMQRWMASPGTRFSGVEADPAEEGWLDELWRSVMPLPPLQCSQKICCTQFRLYHSAVSKLQRASLRKPVKVEVSSKSDTAAGLVQNFLLIPFKFKQTYFAALIAHFIHYSAMVFTDTCLGAQRLSIFLRHMGMKSICLHGQMNQAQRLGALSGFKAKEQRILVCTDVASRGLDVPSVDLVVNYDIPKNSKDYIHRVGRTARAGRTGKAVTLVTQYDVELFQRVEHFLGKKLEEFTELVDTKVKASHERVLEACEACESWGLHGGAKRDGEGCFVVDGIEAEELTDQAARQNRRCLANAKRIWIESLPEDEPQRSSLEVGGSLSSSLGQLAGSVQSTISNIFAPSKEKREEEDPGELPPERQKVKKVETGSRYKTEALGLRQRKALQPESPSSRSPSHGSDASRASRSSAQKSSPPAGPEKNSLPLNTWPKSSREGKEPTKPRETKKAVKSKSSQPRGEAPSALKDLGPEGIQACQKALEEGKQRQGCVKLCFVGHARAGKTSTLLALAERPFDEQQPRVHMVWIPASCRTSCWRSPRSLTRWMARPGACWKGGAFKRCWSAAWPRVWHRN